MPAHPPELSGAVVPDAELSRNADGASARAARRHAQLAEEATGPGLQPSHVDCLQLEPPSRRLQEERAGSWRERTARRDLAGPDDRQRDRGAAPAAVVGAVAAVLLPAIVDPAGHLIREPACDARHFAARYYCGRSVRSRAWSRGAADAGARHVHRVRRCCSRIRGGAQQGEGDQDEHRPGHHWRRGSWAEVYGCQPLPLVAAGSLLPVRECATTARILEYIFNFESK